MGTRSTGNLPAELEIGRRQFEQWRERRNFRSPDMACSGCDRFGGLNGQAEA